MLFAASQCGIDVNRFIKMQDLQIDYLLWLRSVFMSFLSSKNSECLQEDVVKEVISLIRREMTPESSLEQWNGYEDLLVTSLFLF